MKNKSIISTAILLILSIGNYLRIIADGTIRNVEFLSIFAIGVLAGLLGFQLVKLIRS